MSYQGVVVIKRKSVLLQFILTGVFGPLGLFYSSPTAAILIILLGGLGIAAGSSGKGMAGPGTVLGILVAVGILSCIVGGITVGMRNAEIEEKLREGEESERKRMAEEDGGRAEEKVRRR